MGMLKAKPLFYSYENSDSVVAQGRKRIKYYEDRGYYAGKGGNGSYVMIKPSEALITAEVGENQKVTCSVKELIRNYYNIKKVTRKKLDEFFNECKSGSIQLLYKDFYFTVK